MAELLLKVKDSPNPKGYKDGDILCAFNDRRIKCVHAEYICHVKHVKFNPDGLNPVDCLTEKMLKRTRQYRFERIGTHELRRINQWTLEIDVLSKTPNAKGEYIHVEEFIRRRVRHPRHRIFGVAGAEVWYGGNTKVDDVAVDGVWADIEKDTDYLKKDFALWPMGTRDLIDHFAVKLSADITDTEANQYIEPETEEGEDGEFVTLKKRKRYVPWKDLSVLSADTIAKINDTHMSVDDRDKTEINKTEIATKAAEISVIR